ncbi:MAG: hypothetical protein P9M14_01215 [Candidatus Alcyoniella australis]|nr:hypothetical protein [Candidatus Alcyoniella australis]
MWEPCELDLQVSVGVMGGGLYFVVAVGRALDNKETCLTENESADPTHEWSFDNDAWHKPSHSGACMVHTAVRQ